MRFYILPHLENRFTDGMFSQLFIRIRIFAKNANIKFLHFLISSLLTNKIGQLSTLRFCQLRKVSSQFRQNFYWQLLNT